MFRSAAMESFKTRGSKSKQQQQQQGVIVNLPRKKVKRKTRRYRDEETTQSESISEDEAPVARRGRRVRISEDQVLVVRRGRRVRRDSSYDRDCDSRSRTPTTRNGTGLTVFNSIKESHNKMTRTIREEIHGAYVDTVNALDEVFNAFTIDEDDISAVVRRIDKATKELRTPVKGQR